MRLGGADGVGSVEDHGGSLERARRLFPHAPEPWVDLSTGINPHSYPVSDVPATAFTRLPEQGRLGALKRAAVGAYGADEAGIVAAPGTQILLPLVMRVVPPGRAKVLGPTYAEHARAARLVGHSVEEVSRLDDLAGADLAVVVNPNNPDGRLADRQALLDLADALVARGGLLIVDEAFADVAPVRSSLSPDAGRPGLVVLRSFGKFYGLAGVRLGFALAPPRLAAELDAELGPWAVSGPALELGMAALSDRKWQETTRRRLAAEASRLRETFRAHDIAPAGGTDLYAYFETPLADRLFRALGERGVLVRRFSWSRTALRVGLPPDEAGWTRLQDGLAAWSAAAADIEEVLP